MDDAVTLEQGMFALANMIIFAGYAFMGLFVAPRTRITRWWGRAGGVLFFLTCGITHLELALHTFWQRPLILGDLDWHMLITHYVQAPALWAFVIALYLQLDEGFGEHHTPRRHSNYS